MNMTTISQKCISVSIFTFFVFGFTWYLVSLCSTNNLLNEVQKKLKIYNTENTDDIIWMLYVCVTVFVHALCLYTKVTSLFVSLLYYESKESSTCSIRFAHLLLNQMPVSCGWINKNKNKK